MTRAAASAALRWGGGVAIAVVAVTRCVVFFAAHLVFDIDPAVDATPIQGLGPAGSLALDAVLLLACGAALLGEALAGRRLEWALLAAAFVPAPVVLWHGASDAGDLWRGATWLGAATAAVAVAHLARDRGLRVVLASILLAALGPLLVRGTANVTYEYADTVAMFETRSAEILAGNGWEPGSPQARIFERRLRQRQPSGWFVTANIFASVMAFGLVAAVGFAIAAARAGLASGWVGLMMLLALATGVAVWATGSKGAVLVSAAGIVLVAAPFLHRRLAGLLRDHGRILAVVCVLAAMGGVVVRGAALPESFAGDRSLLFRWHYMVSSAAIVRAHPGLGVGPDGYQAAYVAHRVPRNPEEVASAHSVFWDWLASLGLAGAGWIALVTVLLWRAGGALARADDDADADDDDADEPGPRLSTRGVGLVVVAALTGLAIGLRAEAAGLDAFVGLVRGLGLALGLGLGFAFAHLVVRADGRVVAWALAAAAVALAVHAQIEMTLTQPGAAVWGLCVLGLAGRCHDDGVAAGRRVTGMLAALIPPVCAAWLAVTGVVPAWRAQGLMIDAAETVGASADGGERERVEARRQAARTLAAAHVAMPTDQFPRIVAARQLRLAAAATRPPNADLLAEALALAHAAVEDGGGAPAQAVAISVHRALAEVTADTSAWDAAVALARSMVEDDPNGLGPRRRLADVLWDAGRRDEARVEYRRTLEIDGAFGLDPLKQLPVRERRQVERRLGGS